MSTLWMVLLAWLALWVIGAALWLIADYDLIPRPVANLWQRIKGAARGKVMGL